MLVEMFKMTNLEQGQARHIQVSIQHRCKDTHQREGAIKLVFNINARIRTKGMAQSSCYSTSMQGYAPKGWSIHVSIQHQCKDTHQRDGAFTLVFNIDARIRIKGI